MDTRTLEIMEIEEMQRRLNADPTEADHLVEVHGTREALEEMRKTIAAHLKQQEAT